EVILHMGKHRLIAKESSIDMHSSIDQAYDSLKKQLTRLHDKANSKKRRNFISDFFQPIVKFRGRGKRKREEAPGKIIKSNAFAVKPMLPEEAKLELELSRKNFIMFKNADTGEANVLYRKESGDYALIEPNF
ncbi:MAG: HPF/RaiA family ribosome-associated protein, partial [Candidatus Omnitrophica bacterium]|nr:HPF/RaiA family ribosome-associated protein [Candidatus Omnitrophota bacterium]